MNLACDLNVFSREGSGSVLRVLPTISMSDAIDGFLILGTKGAEDYM